MNLIMPGYKITEKIHEGQQTIIYRGIKELDQTKVILKATKSSYPTLQEITRLRHEYNILQSLHIEGITQILSLENINNGLALVSEDFEGISLKSLITEQKISISYMISIAMQLAEILFQLHKQHVIHKDIKPHNILVNEKTGKVNLIDFSIASRLSKETPSITNPDLLEGTLAYMSPEQTGRMNRAIDYRTDLYSLGATLYEVFTGKLPFVAADAMELVHSHIAKVALAPHLENPVIPPTVSAIILKLLSKTAEERYQSSLGLKADLERCYQQLTTTGQVELFTPGTLDKSGQFLIPQKLYGREVEVAQLMSAFERVSLGQTEMVLVSGYSGIGKSSLVNEVHKPIVRQRGYFIAGKFDQFKRNIPYAALIQAFQDLIQQLLTEKAESLDNWKSKLLTALGENGQVIIDVIPELERIIGRQPAVSEAGAAEKQNRFNRVFQEFIQVFAQKSHPLVLFLDDLQWADNTSLKLIQILMTDADSQYFLLIGAYRDNEVDAVHPLTSTVEKIQEEKGRINNIVLQQLSLASVLELIADTLEVENNGKHHQGISNTRERTQPLAELLYNKTQGNPFFLTQLLQTLYSDELLIFNFAQECWQWDIEQILTREITDYSIVELIARNIQKLPEETQQVLKLAACIGNRFNLYVLAVSAETAASETATFLWAALQTGLVLPLSESYKVPLVGAADWEQNNYSLQIGYKFLHDRVQQAAYSLIPEEEKKATHLKIGQLVLASTPEAEIAENVFDIVNQLNMGREFIQSQVEKDKLAELNLLAGKKAKDSNAYDTAARYLNASLELLGKDSWESQYQLTLDIHVEAVGAEYLNTNFDRANQLSEVVFERAKTLLEKIPVYETKIQFYMVQNQMQEVIDTVMPLLEMLGFPLPKKVSKIVILIELMQIKIKLGRKQIDELVALPLMKDPYKLATMRLLNTVFLAASATNPELLPVLSTRMIHFSLKYGNSPQTAIGYVLYGLILCTALKDINSGYQFGQLAVKLINDFDFKQLKPTVYVLFNACIAHWKQSAKSLVDDWLEVMKISLEVGNIEYYCYAVVGYYILVFQVGRDLENLAKKHEVSIKTIAKFKQEYHIRLNNLWRKVFLNLCDRDLEEDFFINESENQALQSLTEINNRTFYFHEKLTQCILAYFMKNYVEAVETATSAEKYTESILGSTVFYIHNFYYSLSLLAVYFDNSTEKQRKVLNKVAANQKLRKNWAIHAPMNYQHEYDLIEAEKARVLGQDYQAIKYYEQAIAGAKKQGYIHEEALAWELAAEFYFSRNLETTGKAYLLKSYYAYIQWGALAKVKDLEKRYPEIFLAVLRREAANLDFTTTTTFNFTLTSSTATAGSNSSMLDMLSVMKASQAISGELVLEKLFANLMKILMENAGARRGFLLLKKADKLLPVASGKLENNQVVLIPSDDLLSLDDLPFSVINYVERTLETVILSNACHEGVFINDSYIVKHQLKSILGLPIIYQGKLIGVLYLENNLAIGAFTQQRLEVLKILTSQAAISLENAMLYHELQESAVELEGSLHKLQQTQAQLVQTEKISSLGQLVAGVAHEVNNPVSFISGNLHHAKEYTADLMKHINLYQKYFPNPPAEIQENEEDIELEYLIEDLPKMLSSMKLGTDRIREIMQSLRNFSRTDTTEKKPADIHAGIDSTLMILQHRLKPKGELEEIRIVKEYGDLPEIACYAGSLNQVFMNILANSIDAMEEARVKHKKTITIRTEMIDGDSVVIRIKDDGPGMTEEVRQRLFDAFFTTKPEGKGTGLGLSISHQIVVEKHGGKLECISVPGEGAEFLIEIPIN